MSVPLLRHVKTLHTRFLLALLLVGIVPSGLVGLILVNLESQALTEQSTRELTGLAQGFAGELESFLEHVLEDADAIARLPDIVSMDPTRQGPLLSDLHLTYDRHAQLAAANLSGQLQAAAILPPVPLEQVSIAHVKSFQTAVNDGQQAWWVGPALSDDRRILHMHTPIRDASRQVIGVLGSPVSLPSLSGVLEQLRIGGDGQAFVLDETGRVLLHPNLAEMENRRSFAVWISSPDGGLPEREGMATYTIDGETRIAGYVPIPDLGWTIVVDRPEAEVLAPAIASRNLAVMGLVVSIILSLFAAILLARGLTRPVRELAVAAKALGAGDSNAPLPDHAAYDNELGTLVTTFAAMREAIIEREAALRTAFDDLEKRVEERTAELAKANSDLTQEISERMQAEQALQQQRAFLRQVIDINPHFVFAKDRQGRFTLVNQAVAEAYGTTVEDLLGRTDADFNPNPEEVKHFLLNDLAVMDSLQEKFIPEEQITDAGGQVRWLQTIKRPIVGEDGVTRQVLGVATDITERKRFLDTLRESEEQFRLIFELAPIGISTNALNGQFLHVNQAYRDMVEYSDEELMQKSFREITHPDDIEENLTWHEKMFAGEILHFQMEKRYITKHGNIIYIILQVALVRDVNGQPLHFIAQAVDITERKRAEEALAVARDQALEANQFKDQLLAKVSHELRTPLNAILGYAGMLREDVCGPLTSQQREMIMRMVANVDKLINHIDKLLEQAQIKANKERKLEATSFAPADLIDHALFALSPQAQAKGLKLTDHIDSDVPPVLSGDVQHLQDILINLVSNAIKFTRQGQVHITIYRPDESHWAMEVSDTGPGIPAEAQDHIFEPFKQVDGSITREHGGIGLGLAIVKQLTILMNGQISLSSPTGQGSTFTVRLPLLEPEQEKIG